MASFSISATPEFNADRPMLKTLSSGDRAIALGLFGLPHREAIERQTQDTTGR